MHARALVAAALLLTVVCLPGALAHANYFSSEPARGARLSSPPERVVVVLSEEVDPAGTSLEVRDQDGRRVDTGETVVENSATPRLVIALTEIGAGAYTVTWRALSSVDGHVTDGNFGFAVGAYEPPPGSDAGVRWDIASASARTFLYLGFALCFGALAFIGWVESRPVAPAQRRLLGRVLLVGAALQVVAMGVLFVSTWGQTGLALGAFAQGTSVGIGLALRLLVATAMFTAVALTFSRPRLQASLALGLLALSSLGSARFGHAGEAGAWASAIDWLHLVSAACWLGGLGFFLAYLWTARPEDAAHVRATGLRFSRLAIVSVALLGLSGLLASFVILGSDAFLAPLGVLDHPYGLILAAKVGLFAAMLVVASFNRFLFLGARRPVTHSAHRPFRRVVAVEAAMGVAVLVLAGLLTSISPPSATADSSGPSGFVVAREGENFNVTLHARPEPAVGQSSNVSLVIREVATGELLESAYRVRLTLASQDDPELGEQSWTANATEPGTWSVDGILFTTSGNFTAFVVVQTENVFREEVALPMFVPEDG